jgi:hypothetical protein
MKWPTGTMVAMASVGFFGARQSRKPFLVLQTAHAELNPLGSRRHKVLRRDHKLGQRIAYGSRITRAISRELDRPPGAHQQLRVETLFQLPKSLADRAGSQKQFF